MLLIEIFCLLLLVGTGKAAPMPDAPLQETPPIVLTLTNILTTVALVTCSSELDGSLLSRCQIKTATSSITVPSSTLSLDANPIPTATAFDVPSTSIHPGVTATISSVPPNFSTDIMTNTMWTANTWFTTEKQGQSTVVPVLVGCPGCGGLHGGIILWNLPSLPKVSFQFPNLPNLPKFHLPCVRILGVSAGDCQTPPVTEGAEPPQNSEEPNEPVSASDSRTPTTTQQTTTTTSASSSCSQVTASYCTPSVICQPGQSGNACATTSACSTATACSLEGTTKTITATAVPQMVRPLKEPLPGDNERVQQLLRSFHPGDKDAVRTIAEIDLGVFWWEAALTEDQIAKVKETKLVSSVDELCRDDCGDIDTLELGSSKRDLGVTRADGSPFEVSFFNWEEGRRLENYGGNYFYDASAGDNIPVYIVDRGANLNNPEFEDIASKVRWIQVTPGDDAQNDKHETFHGTCMLSKVAGRTLGIAKKASPIIVRIAESKNARSWVEGLLAASNDLGHYHPSSEPSKTRAILVISVYWPGKGFDAEKDDKYTPDQLSWDMHSAVGQLVHKGVFVVTGSGNTGATQIFGYPAVLAGSRVQSLLVVGATELDGSIWGTAGRKGTSVDKSRGIPSVYAPGFTGMQCAGQGLPGEIWRETNGGTSIAAASVAGLAAYFLGLSSLAQEVDTPEKMKTYIEKLAWTRPGQTDMPGVFNGYKFLQQDLQCPIRARDENPISASECSERGPSSSASISQNPETPTAASTIAPESRTEVQTIPTQVPSGTSTTGVAEPSAASIPEAAKTRVEIALFESVIGYFHPGGYEESRTHHWVIFNHGLDTEVPDLCANWIKELADENIGPQSAVDMKNPPFPEAKGAGFQLPILSNGLSGCVYKGNKSAVGTITCDGKKEVQCDVVAASLIACEPPGNGDEIDNSVIPRLACTLAG